MDDEILSAFEKWIRAIIRDEAPRSDVEEALEVAHCREVLMIFLEKYR